MGLYDDTNLGGIDMQKEQIMRVSWMSDRHEFWVETDGVMRENEAQYAKLYRLHDRCPLPEDGEANSHVANSSSFYDRTSVFLARA